MNHGIADQLPEFVRLRWSIRFETAFDPPEYLGSAIRGLVGHGLRKTVCITRKSECRDCLLVEQCVYPGLFEPSARIGSSPAGVPYVLSIPITGAGRIETRETFDIEMTLLTPHHHTFPYLLQALRRSGRRGIGRNRTRFDVETVHGLGKLGADDWRELYGRGQIRALPEPVEWETPPMPPCVELEWLTPVRIKRQGRLTGPEHFHPGTLIESLLYRMHGLLGQRPSREELERARNCRPRWEGELGWKEWTRYSSRQRTRMQIGGIHGSLRLALDADIADWWPLLWIGQWLHVGKLVSMGLGRYRIRTASLPQAA